MHFKLYFSNIVMYALCLMKILKENISFFRNTNYGEFFLPKKRNIPPSEPSQEKNNDGNIGQSREKRARIELTLVLPVATAIVKQV